MTRVRVLLPSTRPRKKAPILLKAPGAALPLRPNFFKERRAATAGSITGAGDFFPANPDQ